MSVALPELNGVQYVDTGILGTWSAAFNVRVETAGYVSFYVNHSLIPDALDGQTRGHFPWEIGCDPSHDITGWGLLPGIGTTLVQNTCRVRTPWGEETLWPLPNFPTTPYVVTVSNLRLGVGYQFLSPGNYGNAIYKWFCDADTTVEEDFFGSNWTYYPIYHVDDDVAYGAYVGGEFPNITALATPPPADTPAAEWPFFGVAGDMGVVSSNGAFPSLFTLGADIGAFESIQVSGAALDCDDKLRLDVDFGGTPGTGDPTIYGDGADLIGVFQSGNPASRSFWFGPPMEWAANLDVRKSDNTTWDVPILFRFITTQRQTSQAGGVVGSGVDKTPYSATLSVPHVASYSFPNVSWYAQHRLKCFRDYQIVSGYTGVEVSDPNGQDPTLSRDIAWLPIYMIMPLADPAGGVGNALLSYTPGSLTLTEEIPLLRPYTPPPSLFVSDDVAHGTVAEGVSDTVFTALDTEAAFTREFSTEWRERVGLGAGGQGNPLFEFDNYEVTKHGFRGTEEDVYGWETYRYLDVEIEAAADGELSLTVEGVWLDVSDTHPTPPFSLRTLTIDEVPFSYSYAVPVVAGANTVRVDLLFPREGGPAYLGRVDSIRFAGFPAAGDYALAALNLVASDTANGLFTGYAYLKWDPGVEKDPAAFDPTHVNTWNSYGGWVVSVDGSFPAWSWADRAYQDDETGEYGGTLCRWVDVDNPALSFSGINHFWPFSLTEFIERVGRREGWSGSYDPTAYDGLAIDSQGMDMANGFPAEVSNWVNPLVPHARMVPGTPYNLSANPKIFTFQPQPGQEFLIYARRYYMGTLEGLLSAGAASAPAGVTVNAIRLSSGAVVASGLTDERGFVTVAAVPGNSIAEGFAGHREFRLEEA